MRSATIGIITAAVGLLFSTSAGAATCTDNYIGDSGEQWDVAAHWSTGKRPAPPDVACWPAGVTILMTEPENSGGAKPGRCRAGASGWKTKRDLSFRRLRIHAQRFAHARRTARYEGLRRAGDASVDGAIVDSPGKIEGTPGVGMHLVQGPGASFTLGASSLANLATTARSRPKARSRSRTPKDIYGPVTTTSTIAFSPASRSITARPTSRNSRRPVSGRTAVPTTASAAMSWC